MPGLLPTHVSLSVAVLACALVPAVAGASPLQEARNTHVAKTASCTQPKVEIVAGAETASLSLTQCGGAADPSAIDALSVLARPGSAAKPTETLEALAKNHGSEIAPGIRRLDARLLERLQLVVDHFAKEDKPGRVIVVSGYRPRSSGSYHSKGRALDFRLEGVKNDALVAFCKTLSDTGCGYYPNDVFVHMDVREPGAGHVAWVDTNKQASRDVVAEGPKPALIEKPIDVAASAKPEAAKTEIASVAKEPSAPSLSMAAPISSSGEKPAADAPKDALPPLPAVEPHHRKHHRAHKRQAHPTAQNPS